MFKWSAFPRIKSRKQAVTILSENVTHDVAHSMRDSPTISHIQFPWSIAFRSRSPDNRQALS